MKPEVTALPGFENIDYSHIKKPNVPKYKGTETPHKKCISRVIELWENKKTYEFTFGCWRRQAL